KTGQFQGDLVTSTPASYFGRPPIEDLPGYVGDAVEQDDSSSARSVSPVHSGLIKMNERQVLENFPLAASGLSLPDDRRLLVFVKENFARVRVPMITSIP